MLWRAAIPVSEFWANFVFKVMLTWLEGGLVMSSEAVTTRVGFVTLGRRGTMPSPLWYSTSAATCALISLTSGKTTGMTAFSCKHSKKSFKDHRWDAQCNKQDIVKHRIMSVGAMQVRSRHRPCRAKEEEIDPCETKKLGLRENVCFWSACYSNTRSTKLRGWQQIHIHAE